ncbi:sugar porter family MFS transporter [Acidianus sulfidivorans JP7]|uniref:MFS transporter n=1 Tax=Acidianus sulfidivorans JP7 TaxID=619593 RepID=A0A2U9ILE4_9CREN|nr:sugar porter family MFS transporter [Acidianus sulfidivorans]AWR96744.1 sugar porter family MFS transporter [Acidianus sulfidivorans JP7]
MSNSSSLQQILDKIDTRKITRFYWIITVLAAIGGFLFGYDTEVIGIASVFVPYHYTGFVYGYEIASASLGAAIGAIIAYFYTDRYGRKSLLIADAAIYSIAAIASALSFNGIWLLIWRTIIGVAIGADSAVATAYITEYAPKARRGSLAIMQQWMITIGILGSYFVGSAILLIAPSLAYTVDWRLILGLAAVPAIIGLIFRFMMPESPRWLLLSGKIDKFKNDLKKFGLEVSDTEIQNAVQEVKREAQAVFDTPTKRAFLVVALWIIFQQITGINVPFYYGPEIILNLHLFSSTSNPVFTEIDSVLAASILAVINTAATYIAFRYIDRIGRRKLGLSAYAGMLAFDLIGGILVMNGILIGALIAFAGFIIFFAYGVGGTGWLIQAEYFNTAIRGRMAALIALLDWISNFAIVEVFPVMKSTIGLAGSMFVFTALDAIALLIVYFLLPETKGLSLEQIVKMFGETPVAQLRKARELFLQKEEKEKAVE